MISQLADRVSSALLEDERTEDASISVVDNDGLITLTGKVDSEEIRQAAGEIASAQEGVLEVVNDLSVDDSPDLDVMAPPARPAGQMK